MSTIEYVRILSCFSMLIYASWRDLKTREVSDWVWIVFGIPGIAIDFFELSSGGITVLGLVVPVAFSSILSFILAYLGLFGGADFKAFVVLSVLLPNPPRAVQPLLGIASAIYPLTMFSNSALAGALMAILMLAMNLSSKRERSLFEDFKTESRWKKFAVLISGRRLKIEDVRGPPFHYPLEELNGEDNSVHRLVIMPNTDDDDEALNIFRRMKDQGVKEVWVSHTLPFIVFMLFGFFVTIVIGDIALWSLRSFLFR